MALAPLSEGDPLEVIDPDALAEAFIACRLPKSRWTHQAHLAVGLWHVSRFGRAGALPRLRTGIRRLNDSHGTVNSATSGYHETVTAAYVELLHLFLARQDAAVPLAQRYAALLASPLADRNVLFRLYSRELLMSPRARGAWTPPDVAKLSLDVIDESPAIA
jgi:hypothetical protein